MQNNFIIFIIPNSLLYSEVRLLNILLNKACHSPLCSLYCHFWHLTSYMLISDLIIS